MLIAYSERHVHDPVSDPVCTMDRELTDCSEHVIIPRTENTIKCALLPKSIHGRDSRTN